MKTTARTIAIANRKGGVGKTTSVMSLAGISAARGYNTLMVDLDPQANLTSAFIDDEPVETVTDTFFDKKLPIINVSDKLDLIPADKALVQVESSMETKDDQFILRDAIRPVLNKYDYIYLDCPPALGWILLNALNACDYLYVPMKMDLKSLKGLSMIAEVCGRTHAQISGVFFVEYNPQLKLTKNIERKVMSLYSDDVLNTKIRRCTKLGECELEHKDIYSYAPQCNAAKDYSALLNEIVERSKEVCK